jgi:putative hydrolase of the HAD superfamily
MRPAHRHGPPLPWDRIDTVLLDMDGTLLDLRYDTAFWQDHVPARYADHHGLDAETARIRIDGFMRTAQRRLDYYCFDWWSRSTGLDIVALKPDLAHLIRWRPGAEAFLAAVRDAGKHAVIVTNSHREGVRLKHRITGLVDHVDAVEVSHDHDHPKEADAFWERVHARLDFDPGRTLLVDDNLHVLEAAERFGIAHLRAVLRPDSGRPPVTDPRWTATDDFSELLPPAAARDAGGEA